jgi:hypothetical protein
MKKKKYFDRFSGISVAELCCPSYGRSGSKSGEAVTLQKRIIKAIASADPTTPYSLVAARVSQVTSVALQQAVAYNALDFRYTKLGQARAVGGGGAAAGVGHRHGGGAGNMMAAQELLNQAVNDWEADDDELAEEGV